MVGTRDKYNISFIPGFVFKVAIKKDAKWRIHTPRRLPKNQELQIEQDLKRYEDAGIIERATTPSLHAANILVVQKKPPKNPPHDWKPEFRLCVNFIEFNKNTMDIVEQIPDAAEVIRSLGSALYYISVDIRQAFHHVLVAECMKPYIRMIDHRGIIWVWNRTPYGVKQIPTLFNLILLLYLPKPWVSYFDDCVCGVNTILEFQIALEALFEFCYRFNITLHIPKSDWFVKELTVLGYKISHNSILPSTKSVENVLNLTRPKDKTELQALLGTINYIRKFLPNLSRYLVPLSKLLRKTAHLEFNTENPRVIDQNRIHGGKIYDPKDYKIIFTKNDGTRDIFNENLPYAMHKDVVKRNLSLSKWDEECDRALEKIKDLCRNISMLVPPNFDKPCVLYTDADEDSIGAVIVQECDQKYLPIEFGSMVLPENQQKFWNIAEKEVFAIVHFMEKFKKYFYHRLDTIVYCDNLSVTLLLNNQKMTSKLLRWKGNLLKYNAEFRSISSSNNSVADYLSRIMNPLTNSEDPTPISSNNKPFLEYLDDPTLKPISTQDLKPLRPEENSKFKFQKKMENDKQVPYFDRNRPTKKYQLKDDKVFNRVPEGRVRPCCKHCNITMAYSTIFKYYNRISGRCHATPRTSRGYMAMHYTH